MVSSVTRSGGFDRKEPIPGYKTLEMLGRGGYGEVWRALAPGGLPKAVKIIMGDVDASQATAERRALSRIKDVRHPMVLSIERIEVIEGNLVIVMELADRSLKEEFVLHRTPHTCGVPQDDLLVYISDAAEALDFLYDKHSLQHLDVKPENILLVGGRAKLGDFGLVKNLYERSVSMVGGLTPTYAPPELFEGKPTRFSDQYSLAVVYMHMLTGVLPFVANNTAQLAAQHLRGVPDLSPLPKRQRSVIARALSKDPMQRFETCRAMVEALRDSARETDRARPAQSWSQDSAPVDQSPAHLTQPVDSHAPGLLPVSDTNRDGTSADTNCARQPQNEGRQSPGPDVLQAADCPPTVIIGVGGAGMETIAKLVQRLRDTYGSTENWPPVEMLLLDTDAMALSSRFQQADLARLHVLPIPLKTAESYGANADDFLRWLSRRWFYNIPRDLTTGGFRPLGRLALMTHATRVRDAIAALLARVDAHTRKLSACGHDESLRAVVVGSICGGSGGGAILDVTYALRSELKRRGQADEHVHGVLLHATPRGNADRDKARANAYATLNELYHYSRPGSHYPGEPRLGAAPFHGDNATFGHTHLLNLGEGLGNGDWELATEQVADFLYCMNFTAVRQVLDQQHAAEFSAGNGARQPSVRSYDILALGAGSSQLVNQTVQQTCIDVVQRWREGRTAADTQGNDLPERTVWMNSFVSVPRSSQAEATMEQWLANCELDHDRLLQDTNEATLLEVGADITQYLQKFVEEALQSTQSIAPGARVEALISMSDQMLGSETGNSPGSCFPAEESTFEQIVARLVARTRSRVDGLLERIGKLVDTPDERIEGAWHHATAGRRFLKTLEQRVTAQAAELHERCLAIAVDLRGRDTAWTEKSRFNFWPFKRPKPDDKLREILTTYAAARLQELQRHVTVKLVRVVDAEIGRMIEHLDGLSTSINILAQPYRTSAAITSRADDEPQSETSAAILRYQQILLMHIGLRQREIARKVEEAIDRKLFNADHGLRRFLDPELELVATMAQPLADLSRRIVLDCIHEIGCELIRSSAAPPENGRQVDLFALLTSVSGPATAASQPHIAEHILVIPDDVDPAGLRPRLRAAFPNATIKQGRRSDVVLCTVHRETPLNQIATGIIGGVELYKVLASRLHARVDIEWAPFSESRNPVTPFPPSPASTPDFHPHTLPVEIQPAPGI